MASQKYFCYKCRDNGFPQEEVIFSGKDEQGKTILKNPVDMSLHQHKQEQHAKQQSSTVSRVSRQTEQQPSLAQILQILQGLESKIDLLTKLVYSQSQLQQEQQQK